ncbi:glycosyltransferase [Endozoicomonas atrinae]|uniref:glycosyltransferase n=1 Tax=Endozoicomonas atrinae TaxID=1333660 RepID=UPI000824A01E|nr:glycosyltransferase [Endozoicomonas atrinae]
MIYFYPHSYLRDRQLDTIKHWPNNEVVNPEIAKNRVGAQVPRAQATSNKVYRSWKQIIPLLNIKRRPRQAPSGAIVYVWGGLIATGPFIVDIDNPWSLVGYNLRAMPFYRFIIKRVLLSDRCQEIRCMSEACRQSLRFLFGEEVYEKADVHYPLTVQKTSSFPDRKEKACRFLFIGTQFELKGGRALLQACKIVADACPEASFTLVTHLPDEYRKFANSIPGCTVLAANLSRDKVIEQMCQSDVLLHPSYMESFGMVLLEAISCGLCVITTNMYASSEIVINGSNGFLINPPISAWEGYIPTNNFLVPQLLENMKSVDYSQFIQDLAKTMIIVASDPELRVSMRKQSITHFNYQFMGKS